MWSDTQARLFGLHCAGCLFSLMNILKLCSFLECFRVLRLLWQRWLYDAQCWYVLKRSNATDLAYSLLLFRRTAENTGG